MKNKFKKYFITGVIAATGLGVGFAASTAFQDLDAIRDNFDTLVGINQSQGESISELNVTIADLEAEILELEQNQNNSGKQERIKELEAEVADLKVERDGLLADMGELEGAIRDLRIYTDMYVEGAE